MRLLDAPPWIADLPVIDGRPVMAICQNGTTVGDPRRQFVLTCEGNCQICGCAINGPVWQVCFAPKEDPWLTSHYWNPGNVWYTETTGPLHKSCAIFSTSACRFLRNKTSVKRTGKNRVPLDKTVTRGNAAIVGFNRYGITPENERRFAFWDITESIQYDNWMDLQPLLAEAIAAEDNIDIGTRLYWADEDDLHRRYTKHAVAMATHHGKTMINGQIHSIYSIWGQA